MHFMYVLRFLSLWALTAAKIVVSKFFTISQNVNVGFVFVLSAIHSVRFSSVTLSSFIASFCKSSNESKVTVCA